MANFRPYCASGIDAAYSLRLAWFGWLSSGADASWPEGLSQRIAPLWKRDGMRLVKATRSRDSIAIVFSINPNVAPTLVAQRAKGRLSYQLRQEGVSHSFSRKLAVRSLGENTSSEVANYIASQVDNESFLDVALANSSKRFQKHWESTDLSQAFEAASGRYWYDLHLVLVTSERNRISTESMLQNIFERTVSLHGRDGFFLANTQLMPDHLHVLLRAPIDVSPGSVAELLQNETADAAGIRLWRDTFYVGTTGQYNMRLVRR